MDTTATSISSILRAKASFKFIDTMLPFLLLTHLVELCVETAGFSGRCTGVWWRQECK